MMKKNPLFRPFNLLLLVLLAFWAALPAVAQDGQTGSGAAFGEIIDVSVINLEVVVTDRDGGVVTGLGPEDFVLVVDGEEVPIEYFTEVRGRRAMETSPPEDAQTSTVGKTSPAGKTGVSPMPAASTGERVATSYLLFVDNYFTIPRDRNKILEDIRLELAGLGPQDRLAIIAYDGKELRRVTDWTGDPTVAAAKLEEVSSDLSFGAQRRGEQSFFELQQRRLSQGLIPESDNATAIERVRQISEQVKRVLRAATLSLRTMADAPGRKVALVVSGGWPVDTSFYVAGPSPQLRNSTRHYAPKREFEDLVTTANLLGFTLYPVDAPGFQTSSISAADAEGRADESVTGFDALDRADSQFTRIAREQEVEATLISLAEETGGRALLNGGRLGVLQTVIEDTGDYYWLGFPAGREHDDEEHEVEVRLRRAGLEARSRQGFKDLSRSAEVGLLVEGQLFFESDVKGPVLPIVLGEPKVRKRRTLLPVALRIPLDDVVMLPSRKGYEAQMELQVATIDGTGGRSEISVVPVRFSGEEPPPPGAYATWETELELRTKRDQKSVLALYDLVGGKIFTSTIQYRPGE